MDKGFSESISKQHIQKRIKEELSQYGSLIEALLGCKKKLGLMINILSEINLCCLLKRRGPKEE